MELQHTDSYDGTSFPHPDYLHELARVDTHSSIDSNATAPNLPGPGRTLGRFLDWLGSHLEDVMNGNATRRGHGPEAAAREIRRLRRHHETSLAERHAAPVIIPTGAEAKSLKKLGDKLLKYTRSRVLSVQLKALEEIVDLTIEDPIIRQALGELSLSKLAPKYKEPNLLISTSRVLHSLTDAKTHYL